MGQPARAAEHRPGGRGRLRHHHGHARPARRSWTLVGKDLARVQPRDRADVPPRRRGRAGSSCERQPATSSARYLDETRRRGARARRRARSTRVATGLGARARRRRAAVHPRRRRLGRPRQPRRQRLPQDLRLRGLRADRQRLRADRARERRGLGHQLLRVAEGVAPRRRATRVLVFSVGGGNREKNVSPNLVRALELAAERGRRGVRHRRQGRRRHARGRRGVRRHPDRLARPHHAAHRGAVRGRLAPARQPPGAEARRDEVGIDRAR